MASQWRVVAVSIYHRPHPSENSDQNDPMNIPTNNSSYGIVHEDIIHAQIKEVFPLACPVMEYKWIPGWKCELIHCPNGRVELGCVFREILTAPMLWGNCSGKTTWTAVEYNPEKNLVCYKLENPNSVSLVKIQMHPEGSSSTRLTLAITCQATSAKGMTLARRHGQEKLGLMASMLGAMLKHYCEHREMIGRGELMKHSMTPDFLTFSDKARMILNKIAMVLARDENKKRFLAGKPISVTRSG